MTLWDAGINTGGFVHNSSDAKFTREKQSQQVKYMSVYTFEAFLIIPLAYTVKILTITLNRTYCD